MNKYVKCGLLILLAIVLLLVLVVGVYVLYLVIQYSRIGDHTPIEIENPQTAKLQTGQEYFALTYNIGFGAYDHGFSFFMDSGVMADGTAVSGTGSRAASKDIVLKNTTGVTTIAQGLAPDFVLMQEVDQQADRSWKVDQSALLRQAFDGYTAAYTLNFHSGYLAYPVTNPHGSVQSGLLTLSKYQVDEAVRRSFPVDTAFPTKFFDLDRCFAVHRLPVEGVDAQLVLVNVHMSAYDEGGIIRAAQLEMLGTMLEEERAAGNWVVVGGDYNHALCGTVEAFASKQNVPAWVSVFDEGDLPEGFGVVRADNVDTVATCRSTDMPYTAGVNYTAVLDGFIVSDNVKAQAENVDANFEFSDHNPVLLAFTLEG